MPLTLPPPTNNPKDDAANSWVQDLLNSGGSGENSNHPSTGRREWEAWLFMLMWAIWDILHVDVSYLLENFMCGVYDEITLRLCWICELLNYVETLCWIWLCANWVCVECGCMYGICEMWNLWIVMYMELWCMRKRKKTMKRMHLPVKRTRKLSHSQIQHKVST